MIDQTLLPAEYKILRITNVDDLCEAIGALRIRGAPALGVAGAYGLLLAVEEKWREHDNYYFDGRDANFEAFSPIATVAAVRRHLDGAGRRIVATRPTAAWCPT